ncbi:MAG: tRNA lysidine(34) synthetase TilS [Prolixibacteraceae bacterium]|nr:tRNA lysidine(34) synthetase TilS [Prolixibacteraceae bacterium]
MLAAFKRYIEEKRLFHPGQRILLAVSGGVDSMVLLHMFEKSGFSYGVAHCNFQLRGEDSENDEELVRKHVLVHGVPSFFTKFDTREFARIHSISIEMAARRLRYDYFEKVRRENNFDLIATAHHQDDLTETFFLNLSRKTGIKGLTGIKEKSRNIIRPLLFAGREEIESFARANYIEYREDFTNNELIYQRNFIRHKIIPLFHELNPAFRGNFAETINNLRAVEDVYNHTINNEREKVIIESNDRISINIRALLSLPFPQIVLYEILTDYNFNPALTEQVFMGLASEPGKRYYSRTHRLVKDREELFLIPLPEAKDQIFYIEEGDMELFAPYDLSIEKINDINFEIIKDPLVACLDFDKLDFPLLIRKWKQGDYFQPLGMNGFKKLSDFFIDEKIPLHKKEEAWILCCGSKIIWIMGYRIDDRFKITSKTKHILKIEIRGGVIY